MSDLTPEQKRVIEAAKHDLSWEFTDIGPHLYQRDTSVGSVYGKEWHVWDGNGGEVCKGKALDFIAACEECFTAAVRALESEREDGKV